MKTSLIKTLSIDIETYSSNDLSKCGIYKYAESSDFEVLLFAYSVNGGPVEIVDLASGETIPDEIVSSLYDEKVCKFAFNSAFERICLSRYLGMPTGTYLNPNSWYCTMIWSAYLGLPFSLKGAGAVLKLENQKLDEGKELIKYFCVPCKPTKVNGNRTRNYYYHNPSKWDLFKKYNVRDVEVEKAIQIRLANYPVPNEVWDEYHLDQIINDRGMKVDLTLVDEAISIDETTRKELEIAMKDLTDLDNPNSVQQVKMWLLKYGVETDDLGKKNVAKLKEKMQSGEVYDVLSIRQQLSKSSVKKYLAMKNAICSDGRVHGMFQFYGGSKTGRWSGKLVQLQNLPQNHLEDLKEARDLVRQGNIPALKMLYEDIPDTLSQLIRTSFIPREGTRFIVADFSAIEARVIAWFSNEEWRLQTFKEGKDIYCASASQMFHVPVEKHGVNSHLRQKGKIAELALGYGGGAGALKSMGALEMGLDEKELEPLVKAWREANPKITQFWLDVDRCAKKAIETKRPTTTRGIVFEYKSGMLFITLRSGRVLSYVKPRIELNQFGSESITFEGIDATKHWGRIETYGPKLVENIVQATARDILANSMMSLSEYNIVMHVHDEVVIEAPEDVSLDFICNEMAKVPEWCSDLNLRADGYECDFYKKD